MRIKKISLTAGFLAGSWLSLSIWLAADSAPRRTAIAAERSLDLSGQFLIASEEMKDPRFMESVIYLVKHDADGALGFVINRPLAKGSIDDLLKGFGAEASGSKREITIHYGGPVSSRQGFVLHSDDVLLDNSTIVKDGVAVTADLKMIEAIAKGKGPRQSMFLLGYAGWAPGQLEAEIQGHSWLVIPGDKSLLFGPDAEKKWRRAMDKRQIPL